MSYLAAHLYHFIIPARNVSILLLGVRLTLLLRPGMKLSYVREGSVSSMAKEMCDGGLIRTAVTN